MHLRFQFQKALENERERYSALEIQNQRLNLEAKDIEKKIRKFVFMVGDQKQALAIEERVVHANEVSGFRLKLKESQIWSRGRTD